jgi:hypothetical protein
LIGGRKTILYQLLLLGSPGSRSLSDPNFDENLHVSTLPLHENNMIGMKLNFDQLFLATSLLSSTVLHC